MSDAEAWRQFLNLPQHQYTGPFFVCLDHSMGSPDAAWTCWMCEALAANPACDMGCTAGADAHLCKNSPSLGDCACRCHDPEDDLDIR